MYCYILTDILTCLCIVTDNFTCPCLWVGTSLGSVIVIVLNLPPPGQQRLDQPVIVSPSGTFYTDPLLLFLVKGYQHTCYTMYKDFFIEINEERDKERERELINFMF